MRAGEASQQEAGKQTQIKLLIYQRQFQPLHVNARGLSWPRGSIYIIRWIIPPIHLSNLTVNMLTWPSVFQSPLGEDDPPPQAGNKCIKLSYL